MQYRSVNEIAKKWNVSERSVRNYCAQGRVDGVFLNGKTWNIPENAEKPERSNKKKEQPITLLDILQEQKASKYSGGIYHKTQIELTYNSNHIEGSRLTHDQTRYIFETNTIGVEKEVLNVDEAARRITVKRHIDGGVETVEGPLPIVLTVNGSAAPCRPRNAKLLQKYKRALGAQEMAAITKDGAVLPYAELYAKYPYLNITEWSVADVEGDTKQCGLSGSPTKVKKIENIVFQAKESKTMTGSDQDVEDLIVELLANHTIG